MFYYKLYFKIILIHTLPWVCITNLVTIEHNLFKIYMREIRDE